MLPDFFVIGAPKSGTTSLNAYLNQHPGVVMAGPEEPHYYDVYFEADPGTVYGDSFQNDDHRLRGDTTPSYIYPLGVPEAIHDDVPGARLVAILRDPVERAYSDWWMCRSHNAEDRTFEDAVRVNLERFRNQGFMDREQWRDHIQHPGVPYPPYVDIGYYAAHLRRYMKVFPEKNLHVLLLDDLREDPKDALNGIFQFLELEEIASELNLEPRNQAWGPFARPVRRLFEESAALHTKKLLPRQVKEKVSGLLRRLGERPPMDPDVERNLKEHYSSWNRDLEELLDRDLSRWGATSTP